jgi:hypothetical protein
VVVYASRFTQEEKGVLFPKVSGANLEGRKFNLPADFEGELNLVLVPFLQWQQMWVNGWLPAAKALMQKHPELRIYELPTLANMGAIQRWWIDNGMRLGIPDKRTREMTITLYLDKPAFRKSLNMPTENTIYVLLVRRNGEIVWRGEGEFTADKGRDLANAVLGQVVL